MANTIFVDLDINSKKAKQELSSIEGKAKESGKKAGSSFSSSFSVGFKSILKGAGIVALLKITASAFRFLSGQVSIATDEIRAFSRSIAEVNSILPKNSKLTKESIDTFKQFAGEFGTSSQSQAKSFYAVVSAGIKGTANQLNTLKAANSAAIAGLVDISDATRVLVSSVNAYSSAGLTAREASDTLFVAVREGQTTFGELADSLGNVTSIAQNAGVKFDDLAGAVAFVTKSGIKTDIAVTGLRQVFASLIKPSKEASDEAKKIGLQFNKAAIATKGLAGFLLDLKNKTGGSEESLAKLFGNIRALAPILNIINGNFTDFNRILGETANSLGATDEAAKEIQKSFDFKLQKATANFALLRQELFRFFIPALSTAATFVTELLQKFNGSLSPSDKLKIKIKELSTELSSLNEIVKEIPPQMTRARVQYDLARNSIVQLNKEMSGLKTSLASIQNEDFLKKEVGIDLQRARIELTALNQELDNVGTVLASGRLDAQIISDIETKNQEIKDLTNTINGLNSGEDKDTVKKARSPIDIIREDAEAARAALEKTQKAVKNIMVNGFTKVVSNGIQNVAKSLKEGKDVFQEFGKFLLGAFGDLAIQLGEFYIAKGFADLALISANPANEIASGAALVAIGSILKSFAGGGSPTPSSSGSGGASTPAQQGIDASQPDVEERKTATVFNIEVQGSLVQQEDLGKFITEVQNEAREKNGVIDTNVRIA